MNGWSWFMLHNFPNTLKQQPASVSSLPCYLLLSGPGPGSSSSHLDSQLGFPWKSLSPAQVVAISDYFIVQAGLPRTKQVGADLDLHHPRKSQSLCTQWIATDHI